MREELTMSILSSMMVRGLAVRQDGNDGQVGGRVVWTKVGAASILYTSHSPRAEAEAIADSLITIYGGNVQISTAAARTGQV